MIIWGTRGITTTPDSGAFFCPQCDSQKPYKLKKVTKFFTLYFIPLIPLGSRGEYVECQICKGTWYPDVLSYNQTSIDPQLMSQSIQCMRRLLAMMILVDNKILPAEIDVAINMYKSLTGLTLSNEDLNTEIQTARNNPEDMWHYLISIRDSLNREAKEMLLMLILFVAASDNKIHEAESELLESVAEALEITDTHLQQIITQFYELMKN